MIKGDRHLGREARLFAPAGRRLEPSVSHLASAVMHPARTVAHLVLTVGEPARSAVHPARTVVSLHTRRCTSRVPWHNRGAFGLVSSFTTLYILRESRPTLPCAEIRLPDPSALVSAQQNRSVERIATSDRLLATRSGEVAAQLPQHTLHGSLTGRVPIIERIVIGGAARGLCSVIT